MSVLVVNIILPGTLIDMGPDFVPYAWGALTLNIPFYFLLYLYLDAIIPDTYGIAKPCCFCLRRKRRSDEPTNRTSALFASVNSSGAGDGQNH
jgi:hypothetical protein